MDALVANVKERHRVNNGGCCLNVCTNDAEMLSLEAEAVVGTLNTHLLAYGSEYIHNLFEKNARCIHELETTLYNISKDVERNNLLWSRE
jgi:hypothetical protein